VKNKFNIWTYSICFGIIFLFAFCSENNLEKKGNGVADSYKEMVSGEWKNYWFDGKAEISTYEVVQPRYGEIHPGSAVLIFNTEDFSKSKGVKLNNPDIAKKDVVRILKMNQTREFLTGGYPHNLMVSVFTSLQGNKKPNTRKVSFTSQNWDGQVFGQLGLKGKKYKLETRSYFESEGEKNLDFPVVLLEDEIWNLIRINPKLIPTGNQLIFPGFFMQRFTRISPQAIEAQIEVLSPNTDQLPQPFRDFSEIDKVKIFIPAHSYTLEIFFLREFPWTIVGWENSYPDGFGVEKRVLTGFGKLKVSKRMDFSNLLRNTDVSLRDSLRISR
jgi:hypothetical protein